MMGLGNASRTTVGFVGSSVSPTSTLRGYRRFSPVSGSSTGSSSSSNISSNISRRLIVTTSTLNAGTGTTIHSLDSASRYRYKQWRRLSTTTPPPPSPPSHPSVRDRFSSLMLEQQLESSKSQQDLVDRLQLLQSSILRTAVNNSIPTLSNTSDDSDRGGVPAPCRSAADMIRSALMKWTGTGSSSSGSDTATTRSSSTSSVSPRSCSTPGLYIWGGVGQGKTMIMDSFFDTCSIVNKRRDHYHHFMLDVHRRLHLIKTKQSSDRRKGTTRIVGSSSSGGDGGGKGSVESDPMTAVAKQIAGESGLLCLDEFQVVHITDAMVIRGLFEVLFQVRKERGTEERGREGNY